MKHDARRHPDMTVVRRGRHGTAYVAVLGVSMIMSVVGLAAVSLMRVERRSVEVNNNVVKARFGAQSALEVAMYRIAHDPDWRANLADDTWTANKNFKDHTISLKYVDEQDNTLADDVSQPVRIYAKVTYGEATRVHSVLIEPEPVAALDALSSAIHCGGPLKIHPGAVLTINGAPVSTNDEFDNQGMLVGDVNAVSSIGGGGVVTGSSNLNAASRPLPPDSVLGGYVAKATPLVFNGDIDTMVIAPHWNEYGGNTNPDGIYFINTGGSDLHITGSRIHGTLVVDVGAGQVIIDDQVLLQSHRPDFPVLIVQGIICLRYSSNGPPSEQFLRESDWGHNFNPPLAPYETSGNITQGDQYPSEIRGLVYATDRIRFKNTARVVGCIISGAEVIVEGSPEVVYDPALSTGPPEGFETTEATPLSKMQIVPGSFRRDVDETVIQEPEQ